MAGATAGETESFGRVSRIRGFLFENLTRAASAVGVVALLALLVYTALDAFQPATADPGWYLVYAGTLGVPMLLGAWYCWRHRAVGRVGLRSLAAVIAAGTVGAVLVLWLGGQLALLVLFAAIGPTAIALTLLARRRRALTVGGQTAGIVVGGGGIASIATFFAGTQATLVFTVAIGLPAVVVGRFLWDRPVARSVGATATALAALGAVAAAVILEVSLGLTGTDVSTVRLGVYALGAVLAVGAYGGRTLYRGDRGAIGLLAPFFLLAGALVGVLFHRTYVLTVPAWPLLYGVTVALPALAFAAQVFRSGEEGRTGVVLPLVPALGIVAALAVHTRYLVLAPNAMLAIGLSVLGAIGAYAFYVFSRDRPGKAGLLVPVVLAGGIGLGTLVARSMELAGPDAWLDIGFLTRSSHYEPALAGIHPALIGSLYLMFIVVLVSFPLGVGAAIYLEEYAPNNRWARFLEINISNLAGVPSVVYGLLGVAVFIRFGGLSKGAIVAGGFALSLLILPIVIISAQEAIRAVPDSLRQASYGMGATRWETVRNVVLPRALPGILTGTILSLGRAVGETAPLLMVGLAAIGGLPGALTGQGTAMPLTVFSWALDARPLFRENVAAAGAMTLLIVLLAMNASAIIIRNKYQQDQ